MLATPPRPSSRHTLYSQGVATTTSHIPGDHPETPTRPNVPEHSPLWTSCLHVVQYPNAASDTLLKTVRQKYNPDQIRTIMQNSAGLVKASREQFTIRFPAKIDRCGKFAKIGAYFNLPNTGVYLDIASLKKARARFEFKFLTEEDNECPPEAIKCSNTALEILMHLHQVLEVVHMPFDGNKKPNTMPWRSHNPGLEGYHSAVVLTKPLFQGLPSKRVVAQDIMRPDIGTSTSYLIPSKARVVAFWTHTAPVTNTQDSRTLRLSQLPDPRGRYARLLRAHAHLSEAKVIAPDVFDSQGNHISPADYETRCKDGQYVEVEVSLELGHKNKSGYRFVLKQMKFLPYYMYAREALWKRRGSVAKGKWNADFDAAPEWQIATIAEGKWRADFDATPEWQLATIAEMDISDMEL